MTFGRRIALAIAAPAGALLVAFVVTTLVLLITGNHPFEAYGALAGAFESPRVIVNTVNSAVTFYLAAVAVAIGFKMNLFNIGVDGQYRLAAFLAAVLAGQTFMTQLPDILRWVLTLAAAMMVGAIWAGIAAFLRVTRGVSEVISTIMLNSIATALIAWMLTPDVLGIQQGNKLLTQPITERGRVPSWDIPGSSSPLYSLIILAAVVGIVYWLALSRTVFGFSIKATGLSEGAAVASGISVKKMVASAMLLSGAIAGLVGMPELLNGREGAYTLNFPAGIGFIGIAIALLGRNHPVGMVFSSLLWAALEASKNSLQGADIPVELVTITQGVMLFAVVIAYELVRRYRLVVEQKAVASALAATRSAETAANDRTPADQEGKV